MKKSNKFLKALASVILAASLAMAAASVAFAEEPKADVSINSEAPTVMTWDEIQSLLLASGESSISIALKENVTVSDETALTVSAGKSVHLNLADKTISSNFGYYTIDVQPGGTLTIVGGGTITNTHNTSTTIRNSGTLTIGLDSDSDYPTVTMGQKANGAHSAVKTEAGATTTINGGIFNGATSVANGEKHAPSKALEPPLLTAEPLLAWFRHGNGWTETAHPQRVIPF